MKAKITRYSISLLILTIIITFGSFSCSLSNPTDQTIEEPAQKTIEENSAGESKEELKKEVIEEEELIEEETAEENPIEAPDIEYEEIGMQGLFVFIYTTATKRTELQQIVDIYKNDKFKSKRIFELDFFNNREKALDAKTNFGMMLPDATYNYNANIGLDKLILYQED
jgi:hypothetical protein